ncbi:MAG: TMEM165/GDT1 family protein [Spirochaetaceae bacterium]|nr:MAG: TMEM165/GDT1 family protein [Spirochaetaceae bacterium]
MKSFKLFFSTFILVFLAELGDKTQIASFSIAAESGNMLSTVLGAVAALTASTLLAVAAGHLIARYVPKKALKIASGLLFVATGAFLLISKLLI